MKQPSGDKLEGLWQPTAKLPRKYGIRAAKFSTHRQKYEAAFLTKLVIFVSQIPVKKLNTFLFF
jgi:hypothetical protein